MVPPPVPPPADSSTSATTNAGHDEAALVKPTTTKPLPRAIQLLLTIASHLEPSSTTTASPSSMKTTIAEHGVSRFFAWMNLVFLPSMYIAVAASSTYNLLCDDVGEDGDGGFVFVAVLVLPYLYMAVVTAAWGHLDLFAPQTPHAAWEAVFKVGFKEMGLPVTLYSLVAVLYALIPDQTWLLLLTCFYLLGLLVASTIALWLCLLRTYGGDGEGERRDMNRSSVVSEAVIDGLAYLYSRLLYEYDADAGMQQLDTDSSNKQSA